MGLTMSKKLLRRYIKAAKKNLLGSEYKEFSEKIWSEKDLSRLYFYHVAKRKLKEIT